MRKFQLLGHSNHFVPASLCSIEGAPAGFQPTQQAPTAPNPGDNQPGNSGQPNPTQSNPNNNAGPEDKLASFWDDKPATQENPNNQTETPPNQSQQLGNQIAEQLKSMNFGTGVMDDATVKDINEGKFDSFNAKLVEHGREVTRQALGLSVQVMKAVKEQIMTEARSMLEGTLGSRDNTDALVRAIPSAADPKIRPIAQSIFDRAMKLTNNNRDEAVKMTKDMLRAASLTTAQDTGLTLAPRGPGDSAPAPKTNWLEDLMS